MFASVLVAHSFNTMCVRITWVVCLFVLLCVWFEHYSSMSFVSLVISIFTVLPRPVLRVSIGIDIAVHATEGRIGRDGARLVGNRAASAQGC